MLRSLLTRFRPRNVCTLVGRHLINPTSFTTKELTSLLWTALELKHLHRTKPGQLPRHVSGRQATVIKRHDDYDYTAQAAAAGLLNINITKIINPVWDEDRNLADTLKYLEANSDILLCHSLRFMPLEKMSQYIRMPVVSMKSSRHTIGETLADLMTVYEHFGRLRGLKMVWIGSPSKFINCFMNLAPRLGVEVRYTCSLSIESREDDTNPVSPSHLKESIDLCDQKEGCVVPIECLDFREGLDDAHVIFVRTYIDCGFRLTEELVARANPNWMMLQNFPRKRNECTPEVDKRNLIWQSAANYKYIIAAVMLRFLSDYRHVTRRPNF